MKKSKRNHQREFIKLILKLQQQFRRVNHSVFTEKVNMIAISPKMIKEFNQ